ncbi:MAG TPA: GIY-YIG nuclease family protein [Bacteroidales bacterium]|nr:GIY-YIG nuclease family protein [Bacteroidales bacterium]
MIGCYVLYSKKLNKFYVGATQEDLSERIAKHNYQSYGKHRFTAKASDWELFLFISTDDYAKAVRIERKIKSMKSSAYIRNLRQYPELLNKLVSST